MKKTHLLAIAVLTVIAFIIGAMAISTKAFPNQDRLVPATNLYDAMSIATITPALASGGAFYLATSSSILSTTTFPLYATTSTSVHGTPYYNDGDDQNVLFISVLSSSTNMTLAWQYQFSNDETTWFNEDIPVNSSTNVQIANVNHASTTIVHRWNPGSTSTTSKTIVLPNIPARYKRVIFYPDWSQGFVGTIIPTAVNKRITTGQP